MGVASGCGEQEEGVASGSGWNLWVWLAGGGCGLNHRCYSMGVNSDIIILLYTIIVIYYYYCYYYHCIIGAGHTCL